MFKVLSGAMLFAVGLACQPPANDAEERERAPEAEAQSAAVGKAVVPTSEEEVLAAFTDAVERRDFAEMRRVLSRELGQRLAGVYADDPEEFWLRGALWVEYAATGMHVAFREDDAEEKQRWRALVRFGNEMEETVEFAWEGERLVLSML